MSRLPSQNDLLTMIRELQRDVKRLQRATPLQSAAISEGGIQVHSGGSIKSADFNGIGPEDPGTVGWWLGGDDAGAVFNQLALRDGIIGNDALTNPIQAGGTSSYETGFGLTTSDQLIAEYEIPVPAGFSQALVQCSAYVGAVNSTASSDFLLVQSRIENEDAGEVPVLAGATAFQGGWAIKSKSLTGLSGGSITVGAVARTNGASWAANATNRSYVETLAVFAR